MHEAPAPRSAVEPPRRPTRGSRHVPPVDLPATNASEGWAVLSTLIAGIAVWAGIGYGLDRWIGISALLPIGMVLGMVCAIYLVVVKYGR